MTRFGNHVLTRSISEHVNGVNRDRTRSNAEPLLPEFWGCLSDCYEGKYIISLRNLDNPPRTLEIKNRNQEIEYPKTGRY